VINTVFSNYPYPVIKLIMNVVKPFPITCPSVFGSSHFNSSVSPCKQATGSKPSVNFISYPS